MTLTAQTTLAKKNPSTVFSYPIASVNPVENGTEKSWFSARRTTIDPPAFTVSGTLVTATGTTTITASEPNGFADLKVGDAIALAAGNTSGAALTATTIATKADDNTITLTGAATNDGTGASTLQVDPAQVTATLYGLKEKLVFSGANITVEVWMFEYDGSLGGTAGTEANATKSRKIAEFSINAGDFLDKLRVQRSNLESITL